MNLTLRLRPMIVVYALCSFFYVLTAEAQIVETKDITKVTSYIDKETLVLFDLDNTVMELTQTLGTPEWFSEFYKKHREAGHSHEEATKKTLAVYVPVNERSKAKAVDPKTPELIKGFQKDGIVVLGLTSRDAGLSEATMRQLKDAQVNFNTGKFKEYAKKLSQGERSKVDQGIIFAGGQSKGKCLKEFFSLVNWVPKKIVFIDDQMKSVQEVETTLNDDKIFYTGIRYGYLDDKAKKLDTTVSEIQLEYFNKILSDEEALMILKHRQQVGMASNSIK